MNLRQSFVWLLVMSASGYCQQNESPAQIRLRIVPVKQNFELNEAIMVKAEFQNTTTDNLCFPVPDRECTTPEIGWLVITGEPLTNNSDSERFICHADGRGAVGDELDNDVKHRWIKIPPNGLYVTDAAPALVTLSSVGEWKISATYHPPEGSFSPSKYRAILKEAATKAGCVLPTSDVAADSISVTVATRAPERNN